MCIDGSSPTVKCGLRVTVTLSKDTEVDLSGFKVYFDNTEDGNFPYFDFEDVDIRDAVLEQVDVPMPDGWDVEELEVEKF